jgi:hypothetical protein
VAVAFSYITIIASPDEQANEAARKAQEPHNLLTLSTPNVVGEVEWTNWQHVASH